MNPLNSPHIPPQAKANMSMDERFLQKLQEHVLQNLQVEDYSVEDLAQEVAFSRSHLYRKLQSLTGLSISQFIRKVRLEKAYELLQDEVATISEIAYSVGFGSSTYFSKCFHEEYGFPPGELKKRPASEQNPSAKVTLAVKPNANSAIEALHPGSSGELIEELFRSLIPFKPSLEKFVIIDEEEGESLDPRLLAYQTIKCFPWPLGVELRRLFSASFKQVSEERYHQSLKTLRKTLRFCSFLMIAELLELIQNKGQLESLKGKGKALSDAIMRMSDPDFLFLFNALSTPLRENESLFIPELCELNDPVLNRELEAWLDMLEEADNLDLAIRCQTVDQSLNLILKKVGFLARYRLVNISEIQVLKNKFQEAEYEHHYHFLNAVDADFKAHAEKLHQFADSQSVLLMSSIRETKHFLNLSPFLVDTYDSAKSLQGASSRRDVFLLQSVDKDRLYFEGSDLNRTEDLSSERHFPIWMNAFRKSIQLLNTL